MKWLILKPALALVLAAGAPAAFRPTWVPPSGVVVADIEDWQFSTPWQQARPGLATRAICAAHPADVCVAAPALDLASGWRGYLRENLAGRTARWADVLDVQAQAQELHPWRFRRLVTVAISQARAANPRIQVIVGLSTSARIGEVTGWLLWRAWLAARGAGAVGVWLNVPGRSAYCPSCPPADPRPAVQLLRRIYP